jgi:hypothetical protein
MTNPETLLVERTAHLDRDNAALIEFIEYALAQDAGLGKLNGWRDEWVRLKDTLEPGQQRLSCILATVKLDELMCDVLRRNLEDLEGEEDD